MTLSEIKNSDKEILLASDVCEVLQTDAQDIRNQAHKDIKQLGFNVIVIGSSVKIPRKAFIKFLEG